jgi:Mn-containing catalase
MFRYQRGLQFQSKPDAPNPILANRFQEILGGQFGEMTVMMQYLWQGFNCRIPGKYKDMIMDIGTEEIGHVEMLTTMMARLLEGAPASAQEEAVKNNPVLAAVMGGMNPQQAIVTGGGPMPTNSQGVPWNAGYIVASGNLLTDFRSNAAAEGQSRLQTSRVMQMTDDAGVIETLSFNLARDTYHQQQWLRGIEQLIEDGLADDEIEHSNKDRERADQTNTFWSFSPDSQAPEGRWVTAGTFDGRPVEVVTDPQPIGDDLGLLPPGDPTLFNTGPAAAGLLAKTAGGIKQAAETVVGKAKDAL